MHIYVYRDKRILIPPLFCIDKPRWTSKFPTTFWTKFSLWLLFSKCGFLKQLQSSMVFWWSGDGEGGVGDSIPHLYHRRKLYYSPWMAQMGMLSAREGNLNNSCRILFRLLRCWSLSPDVLEHVGGEGGDGSILRF